jgi:hypothetical protein
MVHWFHATRVPPDTTFQDGILPLLMVRERIWTFLGWLASEWVTAADWARFRNNMGGSGAWAYQLKTNRMDGPCGFLCRDAIFKPKEFSQRDYLNIPEIIEHICSSFEEMFRHSLRHRFVAATKPCIVKFRSSKPRPAALGKALMYIHKHAKNDGEGLYLCNTCFENEGNVIAPNDILRIDWPILFSSGERRIARPVACTMSTRLRRGERNATMSTAGAGQNRAARLARHRISVA